MVDRQSRRPAATGRVTVPLLHQGGGGSSACPKPLSEIGIDTSLPPSAMALSLMPVPLRAAATSLASKLKGTTQPAGRQVRKRYPPFSGALRRQIRSQKGSQQFPVQATAGGPFCLPHSASGDIVHPAAVHICSWGTNRAGQEKHGSIRCELVNAVP